MQMWLRYNNICKINKYALAFTVLFFLVISFILFLPPQIGIANSGDFGRIMDIFNLYYPPDYTNFSHFYDTFTFGRPDGVPTYNGYFATTSLFIIPALALNKAFNLFSSNDINSLFYIYSLSVIYTIAYVIGFYLLLSTIFEKIPNKLLAYIASLITLLVFSDSLFVEYFNSFFQEAGFVVCFLLFISCFLRYKIFIVDVILLTLLILSKEQNIVFLLLVVPFFVKYKFNIKKLLIFCLFAAVPFYIFLNVNTYAKGINTFDSIYSGVLHNEPSEVGQKILPQLGLDSKYAVFSGKDFWGVVGELRNTQDQNKYILWQQAVADSSHLKALHGYFLNPLKLWTNSFDYLHIIQKDGPFAPNLGNYKPDQNKYRVSAFTLFSCYLKHISYLMILNIILLTGLIIYYIRNNKADKQISHLWMKKNAATLITLNIIAIITIPVNILGGGFEEPVKHFFSAYYTEGVVLILSLINYFIICTPKNTTTKIKV